MSFFDVLNNLTSSNLYQYEELEADVQPFLINRGMSQYYDCIMHANELNQRQNISKKMLYDYYHLAIQPKKKRFAKWGKASKDEQVMLISKYYQCNPSLATEYLSILTPDQIETIKQKMDPGGKK